jgi:hypothetical protein
MYSLARRKLAAVLPRGGGYTAKVLLLSPLAYWPLNEPAGTTCRDLSGNAYNGTYNANVTRAAGPDGKSSIVLAGNGVSNVYSAGLAAAIPTGEWTVNLWFKVSAAAVWTDATARYGFRLGCGASNELFFRRTTTNGQVQWSYTAGGTAKTRNVNSLTATGWQMITVTISKANDRMLPYINGAVYGTAITGLGTWNGTLTTTEGVIGAYNSSAGNGWSGYLAHIALWGRELAAGEVASLYATPL